MKIQKDIRLYLLAIAIFLMSCASPGNNSSGPKQGAPPLASGPELAGILFKEGRPTESDSLFDAVNDVDISKASLNRNLRTIRNVPSIRHRVVGFTDDRECEGDACRVLSLRRAQLVNDWLVSHGVPRESLKDPKGYGTAMPIGDNSTESGRFDNRRAAVNFRD